MDSLSILFGTLCDCAFQAVKTVTIFVVACYGALLVAAACYSVLLLILLAMEKHGASLLSVELNKKLMTLIVLGSGGHTTEMLKLIPNLNTFYPRLYIGGNTDRLSLEKAEDMELAESPDEVKAGNINYQRTFRIREVGQSWFSVILFSGPLAFFHAVIVILAKRPGLILCNGPGICVPFVMVTFILKKLRFMDARIVYVESLCRVDELSMTGKILIHLADDFIVQWKELQQMCLEKYPNKNVVYLGRLT